MKMRSKVDITGGPILKSIIIFAIPIMLGALVQVAFNAADLIVVGNMGDEAAVASVGAVSPIANLLVNSFVGFSAGINAVLARSLGQRDEKRTARVVSTSVIFSVALGAILMIGCFIFSEPLLIVTNCSEECIEGAKIYMNIYAMGIPAILLYNFSGAIIRSTGDTVKPFLYLVISGIVNVVLNIILCFVLDNKVVAVAVATTASQLVGAVLTFVHLLKLGGICKFDFKNIIFSWHELLAIVKVGGPCAFNSALFSLSNVQMHSAINSYGTAATAGNAAASNLETLVSSFTTGFSTATVPFVGQNVGAGKPERVKKSIMCCFALSFVISLISSLSIYSLGEHALALYLPDSSDGVEFGLSRMKFVLLFYVIASTYNIFVNSMQAFGYSFIPMLNSIITVLGFRVLWLELIYPRLDAVRHTIDNVYMCYTISWSLSFLAHMTMFIIVYIRYKKGKVKLI